jgi:tRNA G10  N-methylase Trm11
MINPIHPFPARMAPDIVLEETRQLTRGSLLLDPMTGSGTVVREASENGHNAIGFDLDPLAVLMSKVWTTPINTQDLRRAATEVVSEAMDLKVEDVSLPWIDSDEETLKVIDYWFAEAQQYDLRKLSGILSGMRGKIRDALRIALSRIIITKKRGASLAWDVSHSRPHRVRDVNDFPVINEFLRSVEFLAKKFDKQPPPGKVSVRRGDARDLRDVESCSIDAVVTSPPYLNAIDYLRGHRLALVWFGYQVAELRSVRSNSIGSDRHPNLDDGELITTVTNAMPMLNALPRKERRMFDRYVIDLHSMIDEIYRVLRRRGRAILVVGNSTLKGILIDNAQAVSIIAEQRGFTSDLPTKREIPASRRYLPPPSDGETSDLKKRMRTEMILRYQKP